MESVGWLMHKYISLIISLLLHSLLIIVILNTNDGDSDKKGNPVQDELMGNILPVELANLDTAERLQTQSKSDIFKPTPTPPPKDAIKVEECKKFFGGIGITTSLLTDEISIVHIGYPADKAGLQPGDIVTPIGQSDIRGEIGSTLILRVTRGGITFIVTVVREKICVDEI